MYYCIFPDVHVQYNTPSEQIKHRLVLYDPTDILIILDGSKSATMGGFESGQNGALVSCT